MGYTITVNQNNALEPAEDELNCEYSFCTGIGSLFFFTIMNWEKKKKNGFTGLVTNLKSVQPDYVRTLELAGSQFSSPTSSNYN